MDQIAPKETKQSPPSVTEEDRKFTDLEEIAKSFKKNFATIVEKYLPDS